MLRIWGRVVVKASAFVSILIHGVGATVEGGRQIVAFSPPDEIARLDEIRDFVVKKPSRLAMDAWHSYGWNPEHTPEEERACGSVHCIAGWLQALSPDEEIRKMSPSDAGARLCPSAAHMFYVSDTEAMTWLRDRAYAPRHTEGAVS